MNLIIKEYQDLIANFKQFENHAPIDKNIFGIGTRSYYENPFTEVLAHLLSTNSSFLQRDRFFRLFLEYLPDINLSAIESLLNSSNIITQYTTLGRNFIDMIIYNGSYVLVFENKIDHRLANPLKEYENDIEKRFPNRLSFFYVLSAIKVSTPARWKNVLIGNAFSYIQKNLQIEVNGKWEYYVKDFIDHYKTENKPSMKDEELTFFKSNFSKIISANNHLNDFIKTIPKLIQVQLPEELNIRTSDVNLNFGDSNTRALRIYPTEGNSNVVILLMAENNLSVSLYYYVESKELVETIYMNVGNEKYKWWTEGQVCCYTLHPEKRFSDLKVLIDECVSQITKMANYFK